jgi:hypothetical protein
VNVETTRSRLLVQHDHLRDLFDQILVLADRFLAGKPVDDPLRSKLADLRDAFSEHNELEQSLLEPMLRASGAWGPARIARMLEEHAAEHVAFGAFLQRPLAEIARGMVDFVEEIDAHMAAEERTFLSSAVAREVIADPRE